MNPTLLHLIGDLAIITFFAGAVLVLVGVLALCLPYRDGAE